MKSGFTLAEVLITLGIIGVVAAMTLPTVIQKYQKKEAAARLKKFVSTFSQAILFAENDYGPHADWEIGENNSSQASLDFLNTYIKPYVKYSSIEKSTTPYGNAAASMKFLDGSIVTVKIGACYDIYFDINGDNKPNTIGQDIFIFIMCRIQSACQIKPVFRSFYCATKANYEKYYPQTREAMVTLCKENSKYCTILLENDNWEFKDDYPYVLR